MDNTYGAGISRPKPIGWKPKNALSEEAKHKILILYRSFNFSKISRITGVSDNCIRKFVREHYGKE